MLYGQAGNVGSYRQALLYAQLFEAAARGSTDPIAELRCNRILARALSDLGQHTRAQQRVEHALRSSRAANSRVALHAYEIDDWIAARAILAKALWLRGHPDDAKMAADECIAEALQIGHEQSTCWAIAFNICPIAIWRGDFDQAETLVSLLVQRSQRVFKHYHQWGLLYRQFLVGAASGRVAADCHSHLKAKIAAQADLFATFDPALPGRILWRERRLTRRFGAPLRC
jgi:tetratricopeptide (TPR) repeat protein